MKTEDDEFGSNDEINFIIPNHTLVQSDLKH